MEGVTKAGFTVIKLNDFKLMFLPHCMHVCVCVCVCVCVVIIVQNWLKVLFNTQSHQSNNYLYNYKSPSKIHPVYNIGLLILSIITY
jgi:hypothetical protein